MRWLHRFRPVLWLVLFAVLCFGLQYGAFGAIGMNRIAPELISALLVTISLCMGPYWSLPVSLVLGFVADCLLGHGLGFHMFVYGAVAGFAALDGIRGRSDLPWMAPVLSGGAFLLKRLLALGILYFGRVMPHLDILSILWSFLSLLATMVASFLIHSWLYRRLQTGLVSRYSGDLRFHR